MNRKKIIHLWSISSKFLCDRLQYFSIIREIIVYHKRCQQMTARLSDFSEDKLKSRIVVILHSVQLQLEVVGTLWVDLLTVPRFKLASAILCKLLTIKPQKWLLVKLHIKLVSSFQKFISRATLAGFSFTLLHFKTQPYDTQCLFSQKMRQAYVLCSFICVCSIAYCIVIHFQCSRF